MTIRSWMAAGLLLVAASLSLSACGRKGAPHPPGPPDQVIYPKIYPKE